MSMLLLANCGRPEVCQGRPANNDIIIDHSTTDEVAEDAKAHPIQSKVYPDALFGMRTISQQSEQSTRASGSVGCGDTAGRPRRLSCQANSDCGCSVCSDHGSTKQTVSGLKRFAHVFRLSHFMKRRKTFGYRPRVPSEVDLRSHPEVYWWSDGNPCCDKIKKDLYHDGDVHIMSKLIEVKLVPSFAGNRTCDHPTQYDWFAKYCENGRVDRAKRYVVFSLKVGDKTVTTLNEILPDHVNKGDWEGLFATPQACEDALKSRLKICVVPANSPFPVPAKGPREADYVLDYWSKKDVSIMQQNCQQGRTRVVMVTVNLSVLSFPCSLGESLPFTMTSPSFQNGKVQRTLPEVQPTESQIRRMTRMAAQHGAVNLAQGFPNESPDFEIKDEAVRAILGGNAANADALKSLDVEGLVKDGHTTLHSLLSAVDEAMTGNDELNQYAIPYGRTDLRQAIAGYYRRFYDFEVDAEEELTVCLGATEAMACTLRALCKPGDSVVLGEGSIRMGILILIFEPFHEIYPNQAAVFYLNTKYCRLYEGDDDDDDEWHVDWDMFESRLQEGDVKCIVLNTPHNPTGKVFTKAEMTRIAELAVKYDAYVVTDEIYEHMIFEGEPHRIIASLPGMRDRSFIISAISKSASATGWRVGWVISPRKYTEIIRAVHDQMVLQSPSPMQFGTIAFTQLGDDYFKHYLPGK
ncbi:hypothetical protein FOZ61_007049 [Perkinsus olseni]|uniref:Aminotransferase class I/classII large domain-containing protein n=1 Tax=Perkinsus olseni TaxID=32597 RepID=A0A7J6LAX2_PEROL|nr:hypothetical protein FOZ61_007049 [Perkinsus olseni]